MPISLPVPFSGSFTGDTNVVIAEGTPTLGSASLKAAEKFQTLDNAPISWNLFSDQGSLKGSLTLFPETMSGLQVAPFSAGGVRRVYTLRSCVDLIEGGKTCSSNFQCFEFPTDYVPSFSAGQVVPDDPGAKAVVRKAACSGNNDKNGQLVDARFLMGMVQRSNGDFLFYSQEDSPIYLQGFGFDPKSGSSESKVVFTVIFQGGSVHQPLPPNSDTLAVLATPLFLPGSDAVVGTEIDSVKEVMIFSPDLFQGKFDANLLIGNSTLRINNAVTLHHRIPEIDGVIRDLIATEFAEDPVVTPEFLENGMVFLNSIPGTSDPINCDPAANEATGVFRDLCDQYGTLNVQLLCFIYLDQTSITVFNIQGAWILLRP
jgi:hypothetical protein